MLIEKEIKDTTVSLIEAFHYRYHPLSKRIKELIKTELKVIKHIDVVFTMPFWFRPFFLKKDDIRLNYELGGGISIKIIKVA
jgi:predicted dehydrogenase